MPYIGIVICDVPSPPHFRKPLYAPTGRFCILGATHARQSLKGGSLELNGLSVEDCADVLARSAKNRIETTIQATSIVDGAFISLLGEQIQSRISFRRQVFSAPKTLPEDAAWTGRGKVSAGEKNNTHDKLFHNLTLSDNRGPSAASVRTIVDVFG